MRRQLNPVTLRSPSWVHIRATGEWIYAGDGLVEITDSPAPF